MVQTRSRGVERTILRYLRKRDWLMVACCVILIVCQIYLDLRIPEYMSEITYHLEVGDTTDVVVRCGRDMLACAFISLGLAICTPVLASRVASALCRTLRELQFRRIQTWSRQDLDSFSVASLITRSTNDIYQIQQFIGLAICTVIKAPILAVWAIFKIAASAFEWTAASAVAMVVLLVAMTLILWRGVPYIRKMQWFVDAVNAETRGELEGMRTIRAYNAEQRTMEDFDKTSEDLRDNAVKTVRIMSALHPFALSMISFLTMTIYWIGAAIINSASGDVDHQMLLFSDMIKFTTYATMVLSSVMMAKGVLKLLPNIIISSRRIEEVISHESPIKDGPLKASDASEPGAVSFDHVSFSYPGTDVEVLHDVSFSVGRGETLAIIGPTASGKSTVINLIARLYDASSGTVSVGGSDIKQYTIDELNSMIGYVPQTAVVFTGSMKDNVCYGGAEGTDEEAMRALRIAQLDDLVHRMPEGLDSDLSQHGWNLSGGQKQRLSIARAVHKDPSIYLFDDTFSALDSKTDRDLRSVLSKETSGSTKIIVTQRVGTILDADRIIVLENGAVVGSGKHSELMESCDLYREIAMSQPGALDVRPRARRQGAPEGTVVDPRRGQAQKYHGRDEVPDNLHGQGAPRPGARHSS